jgi:2-isopropylmalate synthase
MVDLYDTTLRDGAQYEGISFSVRDKIVVTKALDDLGIHYIEGGWPGSNPKDAAFFEKAKTISLNNSTLTAFGSTRRQGIDVSKDNQIKMLLDAETPVITLVGKTWDLHVTHILETSLHENLTMIEDSISYLVKQGRRVFFDAEHFFDGYKANPEYAMNSIKTAYESGAECIVLCDTNGGVMTAEISEIVSHVKQTIKSDIGIHTHNDADLAVANAIAAVDAGASHVQGTINGYGERCGNANLLSLAANLKIKKGIDCISDANLNKITSVSRLIAEIANMPPPDNIAYVGSSAFTHKGGLHASAVSKVEHSYQHVPPEIVGNSNRILISELSGRSNVLMKSEEKMGIKLTSDQAKKLLDLVKTRESRGFQYEGAEASFELLVNKVIDDQPSPFKLIDFMSIVEKKPGNDQSFDLDTNEDITSQVMVKVDVAGKVFHTAATGDGPVNALDNALRKALLNSYPELDVIRLIDYKVRVVDQAGGTGAIVRVLLQSTDGTQNWTTVGASGNIIQASWMALSDSMEWWLVNNK